MRHGFQAPWAFNPATLPSGQARLPEKQRPDVVSHSPCFRRWAATDPCLEFAKAALVELEESRLSRSRQLAQGFLEVDVSQHSPKLENLATIRPAAKEILSALEPLPEDSGARHPTAAHTLDYISGPSAKNG